MHEVYWAVNNIFYVVVNTCFFVMLETSGHYLHVLQCSSYLNKFIEVAFLPPRIVNCTESSGGRLCTGYKAGGGSGSGSTGGTAGRGSFERKSPIDGTFSSPSSTAALSGIEGAYISTYF